MTDVINVSMQNDAFSYETLIRSIYNQPDIACIRELLRNAIDAHIESDIDRKVDVDFTDKFFYVRDYGSGITPHKLETLMSVLMKSGKRDDSDSSRKQTGQYGLGSKTPFGILYSSNKDTPHIAYMTTIYSDGDNHTKDVYKLIISDGLPSYQLMSRTTTTEPTGVMYHIEMTQSMIAMKLKTFMTIFTPIIDDVNFIGYDYARHIVLDSFGDYTISRFRYFTDCDPSIRTLRINYNDTRDFNIKVMIQYQSMLYGLPEEIECNFSFDHYKLVENSEAFIKRSGHDEFFSNEAIVLFDIKDESYGMEPTRSRDALIVENSDVNSLAESMSMLIPRESTVDYVTACLSSGIHHYKKYLETVSHDDIPKPDVYFERMIFNPTDSLVRSFIASVMASDPNYVKYAKEHPIKNGKRAFDKLCPTVLEFDFETFINIMRLSNKVNGLVPEISDLYKHLIHVMYDKEVILEEFTRPERLSTGVENYMGGMKDKVNIAKRYVDPYTESAVLYCSDLLYCKDGVIYFPPSTLPNSDVYVNIDDIIIIYKDSKMMKRKLEEYAKNNEGKYIVVMQASDHELSGKKSKLVTKGQFDKFVFNKNDTDFIFDYHAKYPMVFSSDLMPTIKIPKVAKSKVKKEINVANLDTTVRSIVLFSDRRYEKPTYQDIIDVYNDYDTVYLMDSEIHTVDKKYYDYFNTSYEFNLTYRNPKLCVRTIADDTPAYHAVHSDLDFTNTAFIIAGNNASNALMTYIKEHVKTKSVEPLLNKLMGEVERNNFKGTDTNRFDFSNVDDDYVSLLNKFTVQYMTRQLDKLAQQSPIGRFTLREFESRDNALINHLINKHIVKDFAPESGRNTNNILSSALFLLDDDQIEDFIKHITYRKEKIDDMVDSYSHEAICFLGLVQYEIKRKISKEPNTIIEDFEKIYEF